MEIHFIFAMLGLLFVSMLFSWVCLFATRSRCGLIETRLDLLEYKWWRRAVNCDVCRDAGVTNGCPQCGLKPQP